MSPLAQYFAAMHTTVSKNLSMLKEHQHGSGNLIKTSKQKWSGTLLLSVDLERLVRLEGRLYNVSSYYNKRLNRLQVHHHRLLHSQAPIDPSWPAILSPPLD